MDAGSNATVTSILVARLMKVIVNPVAGHGRSPRFLSELKSCLQARGLKWDFFETNRPGHARELAEEMVRQGSNRLVVMGGDGTISEVMNGILGSDLELGVISVGTGNDVARSLGLPVNKPEKALDIILNGRVLLMDVGCEGNRHFLSLLGVGFPVIVAEEANRMKHLKGPPAFFIAVYKALYKMRATAVHLQLDGRRLDVKCTSIMVQNTPYTGGGLLMAPDARMDDGLLDVVIVEDIGKFDLMVNFPKVYKGTHFSHPSFSVYRARNIKIESEEKLPKMVDGDAAGNLPAFITVREKALKVIVGHSAE